MAQATVTNRVRVGGSGFTLFTFNHQPIAFCQQVAHTSPRPVGQGAVPIQPLDEPYPLEIITPAAAGMGQLVLNLFELFGTGGNASKAWDRLGAGAGNSSLSSPFGGASSLNIELHSTKAPFAGLVDIVDIYIKQATLDPTALSIVKYIRPLTTGGLGKPYTEEYNGCVVIDVVDGEQIEVGTMEVIKQITVGYRYLTRNGKTSQAFKLRNASLSGSTQF